MYTISAFFFLFVFFLFFFGAHTRKHGKEHKRKKKKKKKKKKNIDAPLPLAANVPYVDPRARGGPPCVHFCRGDCPPRGCDECERWRRRCGVGPRREMRHRDAAVQRVEDDACAGRVGDGAQRSRTDGAHRPRGGVRTGRRAGPEGSRERQWWGRGRCHGSCFEIQRKNEKEKKREKKILLFFFFFFFFFFSRLGFEMLRFAVAFCALVFASALRADALVLRIPAGEVRCFMDEFTKGQQVTGAYQVLAGGFLDIDVLMKDPAGRVIYEMRREKDDVFGFESPENGMFELCFSNEMSAVTGKRIFFEIWHEYLEDTPELMQNRHIDSLTASVLKVRGLRSWCCLFCLYCCCCCCFVWLLLLILISLFLVVAVVFYPCPVDI
jgi:hypothetical protein